MTDRHFLGAVNDALTRLAKFQFCSAVDFFDFGPGSKSSSCSPGAKNKI